MDTGARWSTLGGGNSKCKGPEVRLCLAAQKNSRNATVAEVRNGKAEGDKVRRMDTAHVRPSRNGKALRFSSRERGVSRGIEKKNE